MKKHRPKKLCNSDCTRRVDQSSPFDFNIEYIRGAKMEQVDYITFPANQIHKQKLQSKMMKNLQLQELFEFLTQLQQFM